MKLTVTAWLTCAIIAAGVIIFSESAAQIKISPKIFSGKDGLPNSIVLGLNQDAAGNLLIGTPTGLNRFDGSEFTSTPFHSALWMNNVFEEPDSSRFWLGTRQGIFVLKDEAITKIKTDDSLQVIWVFKIQRYKNQVVALTDKGVYQLTKSCARKITFPTLEKEMFRQIIDTDTGTFLNVSGYKKSEIYFMNLKKEVKKLNLNVPYEGINDILKLDSNGIIVKTEHNIYRVNKTKTTKLFASTLIDRYLTACLTDSKGRLWVSSDKDGILVANPGREQEFDYQIEVNSSQKTASIIFEDKDGMVWIACDGLLKISSLNYKIFKSNPGSSIPIINERGEKFLVGDGRIVSVDSQGLRKATTIEPAANPTLEYNVDAGCSDEKNNIWILLRNGIFYRLSHGNLSEVAKRKSTRTFYGASLTYDAYRKKVLLPLDTLLLADENGVSVFKAANGVVIHSPLLAVPLRNGRIIVKTTANEFFLIDSQNYVKKIMLTGNLDAKRVFSFHCDQTGNLWANYLNGGLVKFSLTEKTLSAEMHVSMSNGLLNDNIYSMTFDQHGRVWVLTQAGLCVVEQKDNLPRVYPIEEELHVPVDLFVFSKMITDRSGDVWLTGDGQLIQFEVEKINFNREPPVVKLTNIECNSDKKKTKLSSTSPILNYDENSLTFTFKGISQVNPLIYYSYQLKRANDGWSEASVSNTVNFIKLPPGQYEFKVRARNTDTIWSAPATFAFSVRVPVWERWWFLTLVVIAAALALYIAHLYRLQQALKIEKMRLRIARDLHDDIGSTLSSISFNLESINGHAKDLDPKVQNTLSQIGKTSQDVILSLSDIVWAVNPAKDDAVSLSQRMKDFATTLCNQSNIQLGFNSDITQEIKLKVDERKNLYLIFKEAIANAIKHSHCTKIVVSVTSSDKGLHIVVADNGIGFDNQHEYDGNGLRNMKQRSADINYKVSITSLAGKGSSIEVEGQ